MKKRIFKPTELVLTALLLALVGCGRNNGEQTYKKAMKTWEKGKTVEARTLMEQSINKLSGIEKKSQAYNNLGLILWELKDTKAATEAFKKACETSETVTKSSFNLARALLETGDLRNAQISLNQFIDKYPNEKQAQLLRAALTTTQLNKRAIPIDQGAKILHETVLAYPDYAPGIYNLAALYDSQLDEKEKASVYYKVYLELTKGKGGQTTKARAALSRLPIDPQASREYFKIGESYYELRKQDQAVQSLKDALEINRRLPEAPDAHYMLAKIYARKKQWADAKKEAEQVGIIDPDRAATLLKEIESEQN
ncbi:MAG: tetratricopeptide repeat protein [Spirochaetales bacterium]|jgi:tetratricopeptide (TPR) repeat protein|nr:tetratricopeptide repeat protein [Spirochaetales bacterium]